MLQYATDEVTLRVKASVLTSLFWRGTSALCRCRQPTLSQTTQNWRLNILLLSCDRLIITFPLKNKGR